MHFTTRTLSYNGLSLIWAGHITHAVSTYHSAYKIIVIVPLVFVVEDESGVKNEVAFVESVLVAKLFEDAAMVQRAC